MGFFYLHLASVPCDLGEFHTLLRASVWVLLLHYAETAIKQDSLLATFPFMFSSMSRCWYKLPPRVTLQILNTCLALINSSQVFQAPWKCYPSFFFFPTNFLAVSLIVLTADKLIFGCINVCFFLFTAREMTRGKFLNILESFKKWLVNKRQKSPGSSCNLK